MEKEEEGGSGVICRGQIVWETRPWGDVWDLWAGPGGLAPHRQSQAVPGTCSLVQGCHAIPGPKVDVGPAQAQGSNHVYRAFRLGSQRQGGL